MAAPIPSTTSFAGLSPPWSLPSLDTNFTNIKTAVSTVANYSNYLVDTGAADAYVVTFPGTMTFSLVDGVRVEVKIVNANTTASTLNVNATGAVAIKKLGGATALVANDLLANGIYVFEYGNSVWQLISPAATTTAPSGSSLQVVSSIFTTYTTNNTTIPLDDTIPQNTEGTEITTATITPSNASNKLVIRVMVPAAPTAGAAWITAALFQDATANALNASVERCPNANEMHSVIFEHVMAAGTTSATTFKVRFGTDSGAWGVNGTGGRLLGGVMAASLVIIEYKA